MNRAVIGPHIKPDILIQMMLEDFPTGLVLIDPDGSLAKLAANCVPTELTEQVFYFDPSDLSNPAGMNIFQGVVHDQRHPLAEEICAYFEAMWPNGWGAQSNFILLNCLRLLLDTEHSTFLGVLRLMQDPEYPKFLEDCLANCDDPVVHRNWNIIKTWDSRQYQAAMAPLQNKIGTLLMSPVIRNIVGQTHSTFSFTEGKIIIADLDRAKIGEHTARLLGSLLIARSVAPVYINNLGFFSSDHLATLFPRGGYTVTLQFLEELTPKLRQAVLGIENKYVFATTRQDAEELAYYVGIDNPSNLMAPLLAPEQYRTPVEVAVPPKALVGERLEAIKRRSRRTNTRRRSQVAANIKRFLKT